MIGPFKQRSSWPSSIATSAIGWLGLALIVPLGLGYRESFAPLITAGAIGAVVQVPVQRGLFGPLKLGDSALRGMICGGLVAAAISAGLSLIFAPLADHRGLTIGTGLFVGLFVGGFISYFYRDDRDVERQCAERDIPVDYGRDAHWLDPFVYGAVAYIAAFVPMRWELAVCAAGVGTLVGVVAAGMSHFVLSRWNKASWTIGLAGIMGAVVGAPTGFLFRSFSADLIASPYLHAAAAGMLTFLITATVGRSFARRFEEAEPSPPR